MKTCVESSLRSRQLSESVDIVDSEFERAYKFPNNFASFYMTGVPI